MISFLIWKINQIELYWSFVKLSLSYSKVVVVIKLKYLILMTESRWQVLKLNLNFIGYPFNLSFKFFYFFFGEPFLVTNIYFFNGGWIDRPIFKRPKQGTCIILLKDEEYKIIWSFDKKKVVFKNHFFLFEFRLKQVRDPTRLGDGEGVC